ncbi:formate--tetrahydrofolate ligase [Vibrio chagasii]|nr:formate--tetrahydrofolate ligase [Vibrio chagasii]
MTAITPTPLGEGKTASHHRRAQGLASRLTNQQWRVFASLHNGPRIFGVKGGAAGGGYFQVAPMDELNSPDWRQTTAP